MPVVSMRQLLDHAAENGYGIPAFNVNNLEQVQAIMAAADQVNAPVIMQASAGARNTVIDMAAKSRPACVHAAFSRLTARAGSNSGEPRGNQPSQ